MRTVIGALFVGTVLACSSSEDAGPPDAADGSTPVNDAAAPPPPPAIDGGLGAPVFGPDDLDPPSHGGTITFESIGAPGWYPSRRDPALGGCDVKNTSTCCLAKHELTGSNLTPWDEDLILTLRGPLTLKQWAVYQPGTDGWSLVSAWDDRAPGVMNGVTFSKASFAGNVGTECLVDVATATPFPCGPGSNPYCPAPKDGKKQYWGFAGSKMFIFLAKMPHAPSVPGACSTKTDGNWYDAPWIGISHGELVRAGAFSDCQCYAKDSTKWWLGDGCGQLNAFEVVNDNNASKNLDVFSTNFFGYAGYVGEGPCGAKCAPATWGPEVDLIDKSKHAEAAQGALSNPQKGPGAAFRRPETGYRYFVVLMDVAHRTVQLAIVHPKNVPPTMAALLPVLPPTVTSTTIDAVRALRLPK
jgi:hypothetical protein